MSALKPPGSVRLKTLPNVDIDEPTHDQSTYFGRVKHFLAITNPCNIFVSEKELQRAHCIITKYRKNLPLPPCLTQRDLLAAKTLYESAYHPDTGERMFVLGRMSAQVPMNMLITGGMMAFYKTNLGVIFWQWLNQSFNAVVNYTNRSGADPIDNTSLGISYLLATGGAMGSAIYLNKLTKSAPPLIGRFVPFFAVATANCINIPLMRSKELMEGIPVYDNNGNLLGYSKKMAREAIVDVLFSRIFMAAPGMLLTPFFMDKLEKRGTLCRYPWAAMPIQVALLGVILTFATPLGCALFSQRVKVPVRKLEPEIRKKLCALDPNERPRYAYYNKGL